MTDQENARRQILRYLARRQGVAQSAQVITNSLRMEWPEFTLDLIQDSLHFLKGINYVSTAPDPLGSTLYWEITTPGRLHHERGNS